MTPIYFHKLTVTVITTEGSPDVIERLIDKACSDAGMRADARTDPDNRRNGPCIRIADPPLYPTVRDKRLEQQWAADQDAWLDSWPTIDAFENGRE